MPSRLVLHHGRLVQRGQGIGTVLGTVGRYLVPWILKTGKKLLKSKAARKAGKHLLNAGAAATSDILAGQNVARALKKNARKAKKKIVSSVAQATETKLRKAVGIGKVKKKDKKETSIQYK